MHKSKLFFILSLSFLAGVFSASFYYPRIFSLELIYLLFIVAIILFSVSYKTKVEASIEASTVPTLAMAIFFLALGVLIATLKINSLQNLNQNGKEFLGEVMIIKEPEEKDTYQKLVVRPEKFFGENKNNLPKILIQDYSRVRYAYGDQIELRCILKIPENFSPDFDYKMHLAKDGIFYECQKSKIKNLEKNEGSEAYKFILAVKNSFKANIEKLIPSPEAGLASGILLGGDDLLSEEWQEKFSLTGTTHIIAVSGYNVTIIAEYLIFLGIFLGLWRAQAFYLAVLGIVLFIVMIGLPASAVRAGVMGMLILWAAKNARLANSENAILFSAVVMVIVNPLILRWDIGFQLSFLATLGIIYFYPIFNEFWVKKHKAFGLSELFFLTISAQIFVLPIILFNFGRLSVISPLANILILSIIPLAMLLVFLSAIVAYIFPPLGVALAILAYLPLKYETSMVDFLSRLDYASFSVKMSWYGVVFWYIILGSVLFFLRKKMEQKNNLCRIKK